MYLEIIQSNVLCFFKKEHDSIKRATLCSKLKILFLKKGFFPHLITLSNTYTILLFLTLKEFEQCLVFMDKKQVLGTTSLLEFVNHSKTMNRRKQPLKVLNSGLSSFSPISLSAHLPELEIGDSVSPLRGPLILRGHSEKCLHGWFQRKDSFRTAFLPVSLGTGYQQRNSIPLLDSSSILLCRFLSKL